jgi:3-dehydroquinate dehydratase-2
MKISIINGPNLALLGTREPSIYGNETLTQIMDNAKNHAHKNGITIEGFQSDIEGELVRYIGACRDQVQGLIINPAAYTHTSVAIRDAIAASGLPCIEVHLSNTHTRESFRHESLTVPVCIGQIMGFGGFGYILALDAMQAFLKGKKQTNR